MQLLSASISITVPFDDSRPSALQLTGASLSVVTKVEDTGSLLSGASMSISTMFESASSKLSVCGASLSVQAYNYTPVRMLSSASLSTMGAKGRVQIIDMIKGFTISKTAG